MGEKDQQDGPCCEFGTVVVGMMLRIKEAMGWDWMLAQRGQSPLQLLESFMRDYRKGQTA